MEAEQIAKLDEKIKNFVQKIKNSKENEQFFDNYLNIKGYTYRLPDTSQRLFYTFQEAVYAIDLAKLTRDEEGQKLNAVVYALVISEAIDEYLQKDIDESLKEQAIAFYQKQEAQRSKENQKYHMYQN